MPHDLCMPTSSDVRAKTLSVAVRMNANQNLFFSPFCTHTETYQDDARLENNRSFLLFKSCNLMHFKIVYLFVKMCTIISVACVRKANEVRFDFILTFCNIVALFQTTEVDLAGCY